jgi:hypothetical protein
MLFSSFCFPKQIFFGGRKNFGCLEKEFYGETKKLSKVMIVLVLTMKIPKFVFLAIKNTPALQPTPGPNLWL